MKLELFLIVVIIFTEFYNIIGVFTEFWKTLLKD